MTRLLVVLAVALASPLDAAPAKKPATTSKIVGATQIFSTRWGLAAQGSGQLRTLAAGQSQWKTVHQVKGDSIYRSAIDDSGRLMGWWEKEPYFHLFDGKQHATFALPKPPTPDLKYGYGVEDMFFTSDGKGAIVYMHGFTGGRTWKTVGYYYDLQKPAAEPTLLFEQPGYELHETVGLAVFALPRNDKDGCEHNFCNPLGTIIAWEVSGNRATKHVLLQPDTKSQFSRVRLVEGSDDTRVAILVDEHPRGRHILRWHVGDKSPEFQPLPEGVSGRDVERMRWMANGDLVEVWMPDNRGLQIKRIPLKGDESVTTLDPLPKRTPHDHPLFDVSGSYERSDGALVLHWGEYLVTVPASGKPSRLDLRSVFGAKSEISTRLIYVRDPESFWVGRDVNRTLNLMLLSRADIEKRSTSL